MISNTPMTLYSRGLDASLDEAWTRTVIPSVLWINETAITEQIATNHVTVHVPTYNRTLPDMKPRDILVQGECAKTISSSYTMRTLQLEYETVEIKSIKRHDYGSPGLHHLEIQAM